MHACRCTREDAYERTNERGGLLTNAWNYVFDQSALSSPTARMKGLPRSSPKNGAIQPIHHINQPGRLEPKPRYTMRARSSSHAQRSQLRHVGAHACARTHTHTHTAMQVENNRRPASTLRASPPRTAKDPPAVRGAERVLAARRIIR